MGVSLQRNSLETNRPARPSLSLSTAHRSFLFFIIRFVGTEDKEMGRKSLSSVELMEETLLPATEKNTGRRSLLFSTEGAGHYRKKEKPCPALETCCLTTGHGRMVVRFTSLMLLSPTRLYLARIGFSSFYY